ncbi:MAG: hypothetical protein ACOCSD_02975 [Halolamina sp.]
MTDGVDGPVSFSLDGGRVTVRDEAGGGKIGITIDDAAAITPATDAWFDVPVDAAVSLETSSMEIRQGTSAQLRSDEGEHYGTITDGAFSLPGGTYVDISAALKLLVYVEASPVEGQLVGPEHDPQSLRLTFDRPTQVVVGARSYHESPTATMTVTDDPGDLLTAVSHLGSSIKEWSAERSWPTLRGHPPAIELGDELWIPDRLSIPETDVTVAVPPETGAILRVAPLAHYFGAEVVPGDRAELRLGTHHVEPLGEGAALEQSVDDLLAHALVLDSLVRIDGYYSIPRYEYDELAPELPFYPPELYDEPIHRQLLEYLEVSFETVLPYAPDWPAVGTLRPRVADVEAVPYLLNTLSRIHVTADGMPRNPPLTLESPVALSTASTVPTAVASLPPAACDRGCRHERRPSSDAEALFVGVAEPADGPFAEADWERFQIGPGSPGATYRPSVTRAELRSLLAEPYAHVHYGDGITEEGFVCTDGVLPFEDLPAGTVGALTVQWSDRSLEPLTALFDVASVVCLTDDRLGIEAAEEFAVYQFLGRSVAASARLAGVEGVRFLGDAMLAVARRSVGHPPFTHWIERIDDDEYRVAVDLETDEQDVLGQITNSRIEKAADRYRLSGTRERIDEPLSSAELSEIVAADGILRFDWCPESDRSPTPAALDELLSE